MEARLTKAEVEKSNRTHQIEQVLSRPADNDVCINQHTTAGEDAPQVVPVEYSKNRRQGPQPMFGEEEKEVVPWSKDPQVITPDEELGLHVAIVIEGKEMAVDSDPGSLEDDTDKIDNYEPTERRPVKRIATLLIIAALMIVAAVVPVTIIKHR